MKKFICIILVISCTLYFCSCTNADGDDIPTTVTPYKPQDFPITNKQNYKVYVCGAVQREGYYVVPKGSTIGDVIATAGVLPQTYLMENYADFIQKDTTIMVFYYQENINGKNVSFAPCNVNGALVEYNLPVENVSPNIVAKLHNYVVTHGKIINKAILKSILTEDEYEQNHYKFFVADTDYVAPG